MKKLLLFVSGGLCVVMACCASCKKSTTENQVLPDAELQVAVITEGLHHPWELLWGRDDMIWVTERNGSVSQVDPVSGQVTNLITIAEVNEVGEGGLLGMALHPDFNVTPHVFLVYNYNKNSNYTEKVVRYTYNGTALVNPVIVIDDINAAGNHNGSRLAFGPDQKLYITTGDAASSGDAQDPASLNGKILRLNADGTIPEDNPDPLSPVWTSGHRNPQGMVFANEKLYSAEHGPSSDDEINIIEAGRNYGWPNVNGLCDQSGEQSFCSSNNIAEPIYSWTPTIAPGGMDYYDNEQIPQWNNSLLLAVLKGSVLLQLKLSSDGSRVEEVNEFFKNNYGRLRDVCIAPDGKVYVATDSSNGSIIAISRKN